MDTKSSKPTCCEYKSHRRSHLVTRGRAHVEEKVNQFPYQFSRLGLGEDVDDVLCSLDQRAKLLGFVVI